MTFVLPLMLAIVSPVMEIPFDGSCEAVRAKGNPKPLRCEGVTFAPGRHGQAVRLARDRSVLEYAFAGNLKPEEGAVSLWFKCEKPAGRRYRDRLFTTSCRFVEPLRLGTGALYFWILDDGDGVLVRGENSDRFDTYSNSVFDPGDVWHHAVFSWTKKGVTAFVDGRRMVDSTVPLSDGYNPFRALKQNTAEGRFPKFGQEGAFETFFIGSTFGKEGFDGLVDDVKFYDRALERDEEWMATDSQLDYHRLADAPNPHVGKPLATAGVPGPMRLVKKIRFDREPDRFVKVGETRIGNLGGVPYLEAGRHENDRFAIRADLDENVPFYIVEIDYPDDAVRTMDFLLQAAELPAADYSMGVGVMCGSEYPSTHRILTHRCVFWKRSGASALAVMTARENQPAAVSAVRFYVPEDGRLPAAAVREPEPVDGMRRSIGVYYEDAAVNYDFGMRDSGGSPEGEVELARRMAATMKYTGQNLLAHPGVFYNGLIDGGYRPRTFPPDFLTAFYEVFDREGLSIFPTINWHNFTEKLVDEGFTPASVTNGDFHASYVSVQGDGFYSERREMRRGSQYNICHPETRRRILSVVDRLIAQGVGHPSFKGLCIHLKYPSLLWWGTLESGYNDYCIDAFAKATGVVVPCDRNDPKRGEAYCRWLLANAREAWIRWRCEVVTGFWIDVAEKLKAARPDLKLWVQHVTMLDPIVKNGKLLEKDYLYRTALEGGFDPELFSARTTNGMLGMMTVPADWRWAVRHRSWYPTEADRLRQKNMHFEPETWDFVRSSPYPVADVHDRYWEEACGRGKKTLNCGWMRELGWRVGTINATGRHALEHFAAPLRTQDVLAITKGGWMIGTYGMEDVLAPFAQAFRALPAVRMDEIGRVSDTVVRQRDFKGRSYFYLVNTGAEAIDLSVVFPAGSTDLVTGRPMPEEASKLRLEAYELRSFAAPSGRPVVK